MKIKLATQEELDAACSAFTLMSRIAWLITDRKTHRKRQREPSLQLLRDGPPAGQRKTMRTENQQDSGKLT